MFFTDWVRLMFYILTIFKINFNYPKFDLHPRLTYITILNTYCPGIFFFWWLNLTIVVTKLCYGTCAMVLIYRLGLRSSYYDNNCQVTVIVMTCGSNLKYHRTSWVEHILCFTIFNEFCNKCFCFLCFSMST